MSGFLELNKPTSSSPTINESKNPSLQPSMKTLTVMAIFHARPGKEAELRAVLTGLLAPTRAEAGCLNYDLHGAPGDSGLFLFHENWTNQAALDAHLQSPHINALLPRVNELCTAFPQITTWERMD